MFAPGDAEIPENMRVLGEIKSPRVELGTKLTREDRGQLIDYLVRLLLAQPLRTFIRGFLTNLEYVIIMEARRNADKPGGMEIFMSAEMHYMNDKGAMWVAALAALSSEQSGVVQIPDVPGYSRGILLGSGKTSAVYQLKRGEETFAFKVVREGMTCFEPFLSPPTKESFSLLELRAECLANEVTMLNRCKGQSVPAVVKQVNEGFVMKPVLSPIYGYLFRDHVEQLFSALATIHGTKGVVCRDIRPENILLSLKEDRAYLIDFGYAQDLNKSTVYQGTLSTASDRILDIIKDDRNGLLQVTPFDDLESLAKVC